MTTNNNSLNNIHRFDGNLFDNRTLLDKIINLLKPSYIDVDAVLSRDMAYCKTTYYHLNNDAELNSFFMVNYESVLNKPSVYCGLSAVRQDLKNSGMALFVYLKFIEEAIQWERQNQERLILYATMASPSTFHTIQFLFSEAEPDLTFNYSSFAEQICKAFCVEHKTEYDSTTPFILRGIAKGTLYTDEELNRISRIKPSKNVIWIEKFATINEREGDRLFLMFRIPSIEKFQKYFNKIPLINRHE